MPDISQPRKFFSPGAGPTDRKKKKKRGREGGRGGVNAVPLLFFTTDIFPRCAGPRQGKKKKKKKKGWPRSSARRFYNSPNQCVVLPVEEGKPSQGKAALRRATWVRIKE